MVTKNFAQADKYLSSMRASIGDHLINPVRNTYYGIEGHKRFAREVGYALNDFCKESQEHIIKTSYGMIYVTGCAIKPILNANEWMGILRSQITKEGDAR